MSVKINQNGVGKSLYARDRQTSGTRILAGAAGTGLAAWGITRSPFVGAALARGLKQASGRESQNAANAIRMAQSAYGAMARGTSRGERSLRQIKAVNTAVERVPSHLRPAVATTAGLLLMGNSRPRQHSYHPVNIRIRTGVTQ